MDSAANLPAHSINAAAMEQIMKKISFAGLVLGALLGAAVALIFGKWLFWLALGLVIGIFVGSASARSGRRQRMDVRMNT